MTGKYLGIDVGGDKKGQCLAVMDDNRRVVCMEAGLSVEEVCYLVEKEYCRESILAIDGPRHPASSASNNGKRGRDCELAVRRKFTELRVQYSPVAVDRAAACNDPNTPGWMKNSFLMFMEFEKHFGQDNVLEGFPSLLYHAMDPALSMEINPGMINRKYKADLLDAATLALLAWCHGQGLVCLLGGADNRGWLAYVK